MVRGQGFVPVVATLATGAMLSALAAVSSGSAVPAPAQFGEVSFPNSGAPSAQAAFARGLAQLHDFEYDLAAASFQAAEAADPGFAMAYWGEAMCYNHAIWMEQDLAAARAALGKLAATREERLARARGEREKAYLDAVEVLFGDGSKERRDDAYAAAMADLHRRFPDDPDAAAFYALALLGTCHAGRDTAVYMRAAAVLEEVYRAHPTHPGVLHYLIHCYDDPVHAPLGLRMARVYGTLAPAAPHAVHMTSHIFLALGMWDETVTANEQAVAANGQARAARGLAPLACGHYISWLAYGALEQGRFALARRLTAECGAQAGAASHADHAGHAGYPSTARFDPDASPLASYATMRAHYLLITGDWSGALASAAPDPGESLGARVAVDFVAGYGALQRHDLAAARQAAARLGEARQKIEQRFAQEPQLDTSPVKRAVILDLELQALLANAAGRPAEALATLRRATALEEQLPFAFGPPAVEKPSHELLGELLAAQGRPAEAAVAFRAALARAPRRTTSLRGLARAEAAAGNPAEAGRITAELRAIEQRADAH
jgi:tetratricopeptide (TPR) repeat protein